jgi:glutamate racemase
MIGVIDSGVGGLSLLAKLQEQQVSKRLMYVGDSKYMPYGDKSPDWLIERATRLIGFMTDKGCDAIAIACNTLTTAGIDLLRARFAVPIFGMEPAIKVAYQQGISGDDIRILATPTTLNSRPEMRLFPCDGLASAIESGSVMSHQLNDMLVLCLSDTEISKRLVVVLGCTHYALIRRRIDQLVPNNTLVIDPTEAVCRHIVNSLHQPGSVAGKPTEIEIYCGGNPSIMKEYLNYLHLHSWTIYELPL